MNYSLVKGFLSKEACEAYIASTKRVIKRFYTPHHLKTHTAYFSDQSDNRESYGFTVWPGESIPELPAISNELFAETARNVSLLNLKIQEHLGVSRNSRLLFNVQMYKGECKPVPKHFDGEYFDFAVQEDGTLKVLDGIRPGKVAVLVLLNQSEGGGTRLHYPDGSSEVVVGEAGDLLVFDNTTLMHSVDKLTGTSTRDDKLIRMTIGWRALDEGTSLVYNGETQEALDREKAVQLHASWLSSKWPEMFEDFVKSGKLPAF